MPAWVKIDHKGKAKVNEAYRHKMPRIIYYDDQGNFSFERPAKVQYEGIYMTAKFLFDPTSGVIYDPRTNENTKLTRLGSEGRSTSTTVLNFSILKQLAQHGFKYEEQKILSFTDNRQDAALQAGHFNDFLQVAQLRSAIYHALENRSELTYVNLGDAICEALNFSQQEYAKNPATLDSLVRKNKEVFKKYLEYRALDDLRYSWRVTLPNLEQCALLEIDYQCLNEYCTSEQEFRDIPFLHELPVRERKEIIYQVLDYFRKYYALHGKDLQKDVISENEKLFGEILSDSWQLDKNNKPNYLCFQPIKDYHDYYPVSIGSRSALGKYLRQKAGEKNIRLKGQEYIKFIDALMKSMTRAGLLHEIQVQARDGSYTGLYRLLIMHVIWKKGNDQNIRLDPVKKRVYKNKTTYQPAPNLFFQEMYRTDFSSLKNIIGHEHTGQLNNKDREQREEEFRKGDISVLFCSPTMELGIDISTLNVVHMRNVPPGPANYAQRSGRAGRNGQAALVFTSCSNYSPHDRHYFDRQEKMVAGFVPPPKLDLNNMELMHTHLHALFLAKAGIDTIKDSLLEIIDMSDKEKFSLCPIVTERLKLNPKANEEIKEIFTKVVQQLKERVFFDLHWLNEQWIENILANAPKAFDRALDRWRTMYRNAQLQLDEAQDAIRNGVSDVKDALRNQRQALNQKQLLANQNDGYSHQGYSEFYPYRYLAAEGFLPGYSFTRLPVRTYIPSGDSGEYVSRARFIGLREFGPGNIIYHNGAKFKIEQLLLPEIEKNLKKVKVSKNCGYILMDHEIDANNCPFTGVSLTDGSSHDIFVDLLPMSETRTDKIDRISCAEEERMSKGYEIDTYFSVPAGISTLRKAKVKHEHQDFLNLTFIPSARLVQINKRWRVSQQPGFLIGLRSGKWKKNEPVEKDEHKNTEMNRLVCLYTDNTADALYIEPIKALALIPNGVITLMYALKRAIENIFLVEPSEINVQLMGEEKNPNIFIYEDAEGSLGILSQFISDSDVFIKVIEEAYDLCRFSDSQYLEEASYDDLLSYYNQRYHHVINRFEIKEALEKLKGCHVEISIHDVLDYDKHYRKLFSQIDPNSEMEERFLNYLYNKGLCLPYGTQQIITDIYCRPDFYYEPDIYIFCDGKPHDKPEMQLMDKKRREAIRNHGGQVLVWYYKEPLETFINKRPDIFKKIKS